ncbi:unnamed protein product [Scytosiphon promiscuus]
MFGRQPDEERAATGVDEAMDDALSWSRWLSAHLDRAVRVGGDTPVNPLLQALRHSPPSIHGARNLVVVPAESMGDPTLVTGIAAARYCRNRGRGRGRVALADMMINKCNPVTGQQPLHIAVHLGNRLLTRALLVNGADVDGRADPSAGDPSGHGGSCSFPRTLLRGMTALHWAALRGYCEIVEDLVSWGADLEARVEESGETPLHLAARHQHKATVGVLLDAGADPLISSRFNLTPMDLAALSNHPGTLSEFLYRGVDPNSKNVLGYTAIHQAAYSNSTATLQLLLECGGSVNSATKWGYTPLHVAAAFSFSSHRAAAAAAAAAAGGSCPSSSERGGAPASAVRTIARYGGEFLEVDAVDADGTTPLRAACIHLREEAVQDLLDIGADARLVGDLSPVNFTRRGKDGCGSSGGGGHGSGATAAATAAAAAAISSGMDVSSNRAESIAHIKAMLASASADRAWRRRGWLAILRTRSSARRALAVRDGNFTNSTSSSSSSSSRYGGGASGERVRRTSRKRRFPRSVNRVDVDDGVTTHNARRPQGRGELAAGIAAAAATAAAAEFFCASSAEQQDPTMASTVGMITALTEEKVFRRIVLYL